MGARHRTNRLPARHRVPALSLGAAYAAPRLDRRTFARAGSITTYAGPRNR